MYCACYRSELRNQSSLDDDKHKRSQDRIAPEHLDGTDKYCYDRKWRRFGKRYGLHVCYALFIVLLESIVRVHTTGGHMFRLVEVFHVTGNDRAHGHDNR